MAPLINTMARKIMMIKSGSANINNKSLSWVAGESLMLNAHEISRLNRGGFVLIPPKKTKKAK